MIYMETPRLRLRSWGEADLKPFIRLNADERVMRYFPKTLTAEETEAFYRAIQDEFKEYGFGLYAVEVKENNEFIGITGLHRAVFEADFTPCVEIGWRLKQEAWGKGYATEAASACLEYGFNELGFREVYSFTAVVNTPSQRVMQKIGMRYVKNFQHPKIEAGSPLHEHVLYRASSDEHFIQPEQTI